MSNERGIAAEQQAQQYLQQRGLKLIRSNYNCRFGEIDLIMHDGEYLIFVEVRSRSNRDYGGAAASVTQHKQRKIIRAAKHYLVSVKKYDKIPCRFDVISIDHHQQQTEVEWIPNAFQLMAY